MIYIGIWECLPELQVISFIHRKISQNLSIQKVCEALIDCCIAEDRKSHLGKDNMTVVIIAFLNGKTIPEWYSWIKPQYEKRAMFLYDNFFT